MPTCGVCGRRYRDTPEEAYHSGRRGGTVRHRLCPGVLLGRALREELKRRRTMSCGEYCEILESDDPEEPDRFIVSCTCGWESDPIWDDDVAEGVKRVHEAMHHVAEGVKRVHEAMHHQRAAVTA